MCDVYTRAFVAGRIRFKCLHPLINVFGLDICFTVVAFKNLIETCIVYRRALLDGPLRFRCKHPFRDV